MLEKQIESKVCKYARDRGMLVYKFTSPQRRAVPDRMFITPNGKIFFIEFKAPGKTLSKAQELEHQRLKNCNVSVLVISDIENGYAEIRRML
jgi:hypothetical protein